MNNRLVDLSTNYFIYKYKEEKMGRKMLFGMYMGLVSIIVAGCLKAESLREKIRERVIERAIEKREEEKGKSIEEYPVIEEKYSSYTESKYSSGDYRRNLQFGGRKRFYEIHVPPQYNKTNPTPVVINLHGGGGSPSQQRHDSQMDKVSDANGFIVVYPAGTPATKIQEKFLVWNGGTYCGGVAVRNNIDDVGFINFLISDLSTIFNIDQKRIYTTGYSQGGFMCYKLAFELSDKIAAIAPVEAVLSDPPSSTYKPKRPISVIHFHGKEDKNVPYEGGVGEKAKEKISRPSVKDTIKYFVEFNKCSSQPKVFQKGNAVCETYSLGTNGTEVVLWTLNDGGHTWPGGLTSMSEEKLGKVNKDISASELMWEFFKKHPMQ